MSDDRQALKFYLRPEQGLILLLEGPFRGWLGLATIPDGGHSDTDWAIIGRATREMAEGCLSHPGIELTQQVALTALLAEVDLPRDPRPPQPGACR